LVNAGTGAATGTAWAPIFIVQVSGQITAGPGYALGTAPGGVLTGLSPFPPPEVYLIGRAGLVTAVGGVPVRALVGGVVVRTATGAAPSGILVGGDPNA